MLSSMPSLAPRDSHALWYTPTHHLGNPPQQQEPANSASDLLAPPPGLVQNAGIYSPRRLQQATANGRSPLARLRADEVYMERRKHNVQNYGSSWIKPPGVFKSLHQLREERREMEEHQEALRREQLAQELAEAEAGGELLQGEGADGEMEQARDLDDDIPEAEATGISDEVSENEEPENATEVVQQGVLTQRIPDEVYREALVRGEEGLSRRFAADAGSDTDADDESQMLQEEDLYHETSARIMGSTGMDVGMEADLDDDIPDAEHGDYEHTDTEEELSTSDSESVDLRRWPQSRALNTSMVRSDGTQNSLDLSNIDRAGNDWNSPRSRADSGRY